MKIRAYAPACIGNFAAGFDLMGAAIAPLDGGLWGDVVEAEPAAAPSLALAGPFAGRLPAEARDNLVLRTDALFRAAVEAKGVECPFFAFLLEKNLPVCSGLGSSASSVAATLTACQHLAGHPLSTAELFAVAGRAEGMVSGSVHLDNVVPILVGGLQLMVPGRHGQPEARALPWPDDLVLVMATPDCQLATVSSRQVLPSCVVMSTVLDFAQNLAAFVHAAERNDRELLGRCLRDLLAEPHRAPLVPGFRAVQAAALARGALGCTLSGSGPSLFAVAESRRHGEEVAAGIQEAFRGVGLASTIRLCGLDRRGARLLA